MILAGSLVSWLGNRHEWLNIILLFIVLEITVLSIERARWITPQPSLTVLIILAILTVWLLFRSRIPAIAIHILVLAIGVLITLVQAFFLLPAWDYSVKFQQLFYALTSSGQSGGVNVSFAVFLSLLTWIAAYISAWFILRRQNAWVAVSLSTVILMVNLSNLPDGYFYFFGLFIIAAVLLVAQNRVIRRLRSSGYFPGYLQKGWLMFTAVLLCIIILAGSVAWVTPAVRIPQLETAVATRMLWTQDFGKYQVNPFNSVPAKQAKATTTTRETLAFGKVWSEGEDIRFILKSEEPYYWRVKIYDTYTSAGWTNSPTEKYLQKQDEPLGGAADPNAITYTVTTSMNSEVILTAGGFIQADTPAVLHVGAGGYLVAATTPRLFRPGESYTVTTSASIEVSDSLAGTGTKYPDSVTDDYLQLPSSFPASIRELTRRITKDKDSPYEKVVAINDYLSRFSYEDEVEAPPVGTDGVAHFLYTQKSGFCLYFASAMAVMLRTVDIPSRLVVGYLPGESGETDGQLILRDKHYHAWPQAYFQDYGWVDLEVTPRADIAVAVSTPWVADRIIGEWSQWDSYQAWGAAWSREPVDIPLDTENLRPYGATKRWPFADAIGKILLGIVVTCLVCGVVALVIMILRSVFYRGVWDVDRSNSAAMVYDKLCALGSLAGVGPAKQQTPLEYAAELADAFPQQAAAVHDIAQAYVENRFGKKDGKLDLFQEAVLLKARCSVFERLLGRLTFVNKLLYRWK